MTQPNLFQRMFGAQPVAAVKSLYDPAPAAKEGIQSFLQGSGLDAPVDKKAEMRKAIAKGLLDFSKSMTSNNGDFLPALASGISSGAEGFIDQRNQTAGKEEAWNKRNAESKAAEDKRQAIVKALGGVLPPHLRGLVDADPKLATDIYGKEQEYDIKRKGHEAKGDFTLGEGQIRYDKNGNIIGRGSIKKPVNDISDKAAARRQLAIDNGIDPESAEGKSYILTGNMAKPGDKRVSPSALKAQFETQDNNAVYDNATSTLEEARSLLTSGNGPDGKPVVDGNVFEGAGAGTRAWLGSRLPDAMVPDSIAAPDAALNSTKFNQIMSFEAIKSMSEMLKGATTNFELEKFEKILADPSAPNSIKLQTLDRMTKLLKSKRTIGTQRLKQLEQADGGSGSGYQGSDGITSQDQGGLGDGGEQYPQDAIEMLASDPTPEAMQEFDAMFGAGAAQRVLGQ